MYFIVFAPESNSVSKSHDGIQHQPWHTEITDLK